MGRPISAWPNKHFTMEKILYFAFILVIVQSVFKLNSDVEAVPVEDSKEHINSICGKRLWEDPKGRIVGGTKSKFADWPWMVGLFNKQKYGYFMYWCGATLLNSKWVLTAAHCLVNTTASDLYLTFGEQDMWSEDEALPFLDVNVSTIIRHPDYNPVKKLNDLALLELETPVEFEPHINPICLPENDDNTYAGDTAVATGWGATVHLGPAEHELLEVEVPVIPNDDCAKMYKKSRRKRYIEDTVLCAGKPAGAADACQGDSGGPLVIHKNPDDKYTLIGVTSWGEGCGEANKPGVYARVSKYLDWINSHVWKK